MLRQALNFDGGTNGLLSVDAMQEFRIQTSTYAPEFGRTPGASISILTKSGTNQFHGTAFDYWRNDLFDARNYYNMKPQPKPPLRQNDFGGTLGGPVARNKTFFFFSYEGLRLRLPRTYSGVFYTQSARAAVAPAYRPFVNALPLPTGPVIDPNCDNIQPLRAQRPLPLPIPILPTLTLPVFAWTTAWAGKSCCLRATTTAPSQSAGPLFQPRYRRAAANIDTFTAGATILFSGAMVNEFRANWSRYSRCSRKRSLTESYGAVVPSDSVLCSRLPTACPKPRQGLLLGHIGIGHGRSD